MTPIRGFLSLVASLALAIGVYCLWPGYNPLAKYGVVVEKAPAASASLDHFKIYLKGRQPGPDDVDVICEDLVVQYRDLDGDGVEEIVAQCESATDSRVIIKVLMENNKAVGFHILESRAICLSFGKEGFTCP
jgi:hypothetical protein